MKWYGFTRSRRHKCPDGTVRIVHKRADDAFPLFVENSNLNLSAAGKALQALQIGEASISADVKNQIANLLLELDDVNRSLLVNFRMIYLVYQTNPCGRDKYLEEKVDEIIQREDRLRRMETETRRIRTLLSQPWTEAQLRELFTVVLARLRDLDAESMPGRTMEQILDNSRAWLEDQR